MSMRWKKLLGTLVIIIWLIVYAVVAARLAYDILPEANWLAELAYYMIAGLAWILPLMPLIWWMSRPGKADLEA